MSNTSVFKLSAIGITVFMVLTAAHAEDPAQRPWTRHTILMGLKGSDGVRFRDVNHDGLPDCVTGWEQSGTITICLHPGLAAARQPWPNVRFKSSAAVEDAVFVDLDDDGAVDVVTCCEGNRRAVIIHW